MEKLENKLIDMREMYQEYKERIMAGLVSEKLIRNFLVQRPKDWMTSVFENTLFRKQKKTHIPANDSEVRGDLFDVSLTFIIQSYQLHLTF